jgi:transposase
VLLAADGSSTTGIARRLGTTIKTVVLWRRRFVAGGVGALEKDASGRGRKRAISLELLERVRSGLQAGRGVREVARSVGISPASVVRLRDRGR